MLRCLFFPNLFCSMVKAKKKKSFEICILSIKWSNMLSLVPGTYYSYWEIGSMNKWPFFTSMNFIMFIVIQPSSHPNFRTSFNTELNWAKSNLTNLPWMHFDLLFGEIPRCLLRKLRHLQTMNCNSSLLCSCSCKMTGRK